MVKVYCQRCGEATDELYVISSAREYDEYWCVDCLLGAMDKANLTKWSEEDFERTGVRRVQEEAD